MKIVIVNFSDISGGAARAAYRLHKALLKQGVDSQMLVNKKLSDDYTVIGPVSSKQKLLSQFQGFINPFPIKRYNTQGAFSASFSPSFNIVERINSLNPDIVHLHWINGGMLKIEDLLKIKAPIVWSLHDNWAFTGGCHVMHKCKKYQEGCGVCPVLDSNTKKDISKKLFKRKQIVFTKINNLTIIGVSKWLNDTSKNSFLLKRKKHVNLPNPINTSIFSPFNTIKSRQLWGFPANKKLILFGAISGANDKNKGFKELTEALLQLNNKNVEVVVFGNSEPKDPINLGFKTHYTGHLHDDISLVALYNAVDVMVVPSLQEAFGQTATESMSCETPVVAFATTGLLDIVDHLKNGYLAKTFDTSDLARGIEWVLYNENYKQLCQNARNKVLKEFDSRLVSKRYIALYKEILKQ